MLTSENNLSLSREKSTSESSNSLPASEENRNESRRWRTERLRLGRMSVDFFFFERLINLSLQMMKSEKKMQRRATDLAELQRAAEVIDPSGLIKELEVRRCS